MNEAWMDECHQTFAIEKIPRFDRNNPIMSWGQKKSLLKKNFVCLHKAFSKQMKLYKIHTKLKQKSS